VDIPTPSAKAASENPVSRGNFRETV